MSTQYTRVTLNNYLQLLGEIDPASLGSDIYDKEKDRPSTDLPKFFKFTSLQQVYRRKLNRRVLRDERDIDPRKAKACNIIKVTSASKNDNGYISVNRVVDFNKHLVKNKRKSKYLRLSHAKVIEQREWLYKTDDLGFFVIFKFWLRCSVDLSHLCHDKDCYNPLHLIWEIHHINMERNWCIHRTELLRRLGIIRPHEAVCKGHTFGPYRLFDCYPQYNTLRLYEELPLWG